MYDFEHKTYQESYLYNTNTDSQTPIYKKIKNILFYILTILTFSMSLLYSLEKYQSHTYEKEEIYVKQENNKIEEPHQMELKEVITNGIIKNLQVQKELISINDEEIRHIVSKVIHKIETSSQKITYTAQQGE